MGEGQQPVHGAKTRLSRMAFEQPVETSRAAKMIQEAEASRARLVPTPGKYGENYDKFLHSAFVDEEYLVIGSHVDEITSKKIVNCEYVDFAKLLPRDRLSVDEDHRMELVNRNGIGYWVPVTDREVGVISSFAKWETAFRVFFRIYSPPSTLTRWLS